MIDVSMNIDYSFYGVFSIDLRDSYKPMGDDRELH